MAWAVIDRALTFLQDQQMADPMAIAGIARQSALQSRQLGYVANQAMLDRLNQALQESVAAGEGAREWSARMRQIVGGRTSYEETISRTATHRGYLDGQRKVQAGPVGDLFPYRQYQATRDTRVRDEHADMDGKVYHKDSPMARKAKAFLEQYNCRCTERMLRRKQAEKLGIDDDTGWQQQEREMARKPDAKLTPASAPPPAKPVKVVRREKIPAPKFKPITETRHRDLAAIERQHKRITAKVPPQSPERLDLFAAYNHKGDERINYYLRRNGGDFDKAIDEAGRSFDRTDAELSIARQLRTLKDLADERPALPSEQIVYRGVVDESGRLWESMRRAEAENKPVRMSGATSTSLDPSIAAGFSSKGDDPSIPTIFEIQQKTGVYLSGYQGSGPGKIRLRWADAELEVLSMPGTRYKVVGTYEVSGTAYLNGRKAPANDPQDRLRVVQLVEIPPRVVPDAEPIQLRLGAVT